MTEYIKTLKTPIAIVGLGRSGEAAFKLLTHCGLTKSELFTFDSKAPGADYSQQDELMSKARPQTLVVSPGVPLGLDWIQQAKASGVKITSELSLACSFLTSEKIIGVTGSLGKSTTVSLLGAAVQTFSPNAFVGGNLGIPFCEYALSLSKDKKPKANWVVLELSSYQLENADLLSLDFSAITYLSPNHLERYKNLEEYYQTKWSILKRTKELCLLNTAGGDLLQESQRQKPEEKLKLVSPEDPNLQKYKLNEASLIGRHNLENISLAAAVALAAGWPESCLEGLKQFAGLSHRLENLGLTKGIRFINDSKATALDSVLIATKAALDNTSGTVFLLLGGRDKGLPWQDLSPLAENPEVTFIFFGECRDVAQKKSNLSGQSFLKLKEAFDFCVQRAKPNDTVLLSPGGTSFDEFKSFEHRGDSFKNYVREFSTT